MFCPSWNCHHMILNRVSEKTLFLFTDTWLETLFLTFLVQRIFLPSLLEPLGKNAKSLLRNYIKSNIHKYFYNSLYDFIRIVLDVNSKSFFKGPSTKARWGMWFLRCRSRCVYVLHMKEKDRLFAIYFLIFLSYSHGWFTCFPAQSNFKNWCQEKSDLMVWLPKSNTF